MAKGRLNVYFDCETFNYYDPKIKLGKEKSKKELLPLIRPYLIGACTDDKNSYQVFKGINCTEKFLSWLFNLATDNFITLYGFNVDYDFQAIKSSIMCYFPTARIYYSLTEDKKFIFGAINDKTNKVSIKIKDLWVWNKSFSLAKYYTQIQNNPDWAERIKERGITELKKGSLVDYTKKNLDWRNGKWTFYDEEDQERELDLKAELEYLKMDVIGLPLVRQYIHEFKKICINGLKLGRTIPWKEVSRAYSIPSFGKLLASCFISRKYDYPPTETFNIIFRPKIPIDEYQLQDLSYFGGFTSNNKRITKLTNSRDANGNPNIYSFDVNSMYPWIMQGGLPAGTILDVPPLSNDYCIWYSIRFNPIGEDENGFPIYYKWKDKYDLFTTSFFGAKADRDSLLELGSISYVEKSVLELFNEMCDSNYEIIDTRYQEINKDLSEFIDVLFEKKNTAETKTERDAFKLVMNSLYGKLAERYHQDYWEWNHERQDFDAKVREVGERDTILAGLYITSKARFTLLSAIKKEVDNGNTFLGADTDSVKIVANVPPHVEQDEKKLGAWKLEYKATDFFHNLKKKKYCVINRDDNTVKVACSGLPKKVIQGLSIKDLEILYDKYNDVIFPKIKNISQRNKLWQICISKADVRFNYMKGIKPNYYYDASTNSILPTQDK